MVFGGVFVWFGIRMSASWNDLEMFPLLSFGRVCVELVTSTLECLVELTSEATLSQAFLMGSFFFFNRNSISSPLIGLFRLFLFESVLVACEFLGGFVFCYIVFLTFSYLPSGQPWSLFSSLVEPLHEGEA